MLCIPQLQLAHWAEVRPSLLCRGEDVDVRRQTVRFIERTDANEANSVTASGVVAPNCDPAPRAAGDLLTLATIGRRIDDLNFSLEQLHAIGFNQGVQGKRCSGFSLAPAAMA